MEFKDQLSQNVRQATVAALIATVIEDQNRSIGDILESLEADSDSEFLVTTFKELTVHALLEAAKELETMKEQAQVVAKAKSSLDEDGEDDEDEDDEDDEDDFDEDEDEEDEEDEDEEDEDFEDLEDEDEDDDEPAVDPRKAHKPDSDGKLPLHDPEVKKEYQSGIIKFLRKSKDEKGTPAATIRAAVGGTPAQVRENLNELIESGRVSFTGKARGTKYHLTS